MVDILEDKKVREFMEEELKDEVILGQRELFEDEELMSVTERIINQNESLVDIAEEKGVYPYTLNQCLAANDDTLKLLNDYVLESFDSDDISRDRFATAKEIKRLNKKSREVDEIIEKLRKGKSIKELAKEMFITSSAIYKKLRHLGFENNVQTGVWYHTDNEREKYKVRHCMGLSYDLKLMRLYEERYGDFREYYGSDNKLEVPIDANILEDIVKLSDDWNTENPMDLMSIVLLEFLQNNRYKNVLKELAEEVKKEKYKFFNEILTKEESEIGVKEGEVGLKAYFRKKLKKEYHYKKEQLKHLNCVELRDLYYSHKNKLN